MRAGRCGRLAFDTVGQSERTGKSPGRTARILPQGCASHGHRAEPPPASRPTPDESRHPTTAVSASTPRRTIRTRRQREGARATRPAHEGPTHANRRVTLISRTRAPTTVRLNTTVRNIEPLPFSPLQFHVLLNSLFKVLFTFPSRYLCAIGLVVVFSLRWSLPPT